LGEDRARARIAHFAAHPPVEKPPKRSRKARQPIADPEPKAELEPIADPEPIAMAVITTILPVKRRRRREPSPLQSAFDLGDMDGVTFKSGRS
jgi:hypothetical protein